VIIVSNTGPLIAMGKLGQLGLLLKRNFSKSPGTLEVMVTSLRARRTASLRPPMPYMGVF
jgi:hypothetical protein